jgi:uncharacterized membrane protein YfcA
VTAGEILLLAVGGLATGVVNAMAGAGSLVTVPLLVLVGVPGATANGTNRIGVLTQALVSSGTFRRSGVAVGHLVLPVLAPLLLGSLVGSLAVSRVADETFETVFGFLMVPLVLVGLRTPRVESGAEVQVWPRPVQVGVFLVIGLYGGAFQAGVGLMLLIALAHSGHDLVTGNAIKSLVVTSLTLVALPVFIGNGLVDWGPGLVLGAGTALGGLVGARLTVRGGAAVVRPVLVLAVLALAGHMVGLY